MKNDEYKRYNIRTPWLRRKNGSLLVIDMQEYFRGIADKIIPNTINLIRAATDASMPVIFTQHGHADASTDGGTLGKWWGGLIMENTPDWELLPELNVTENALVFRKKRYSAFWGNNLEKELKERNVEDLIITGVMTNLCCETTARDAFNRDFQIFFVSDATATADDTLHQATLCNIAYGFGHIVDTNETLDLIKGG